MYSSYSTSLQKKAKLYKRWITMGSGIFKRLFAMVTILWLTTGCGALALSGTAEWDKSMEAGDAAYTKGHYTDSEQKYSLAVKQSENFGEDDMRRAASLNRLARTYYAQGKYSKAYSLYRRALAMQEKVLSSNSKEVALTLVGLAEVCCAPQVYRENEACELLKRAEAIQEKALGPEHPDLATTLDVQGLARIRLSRGTSSKAPLEEADSIFKRALAIQQKTLAPNHPDIATTLDGMAQGYAALALRNEKIASGSYAEPLPVSVFIRGPLRSEARKKEADAEKLYKQALAIREQAFGPEHPYVAATLQHYAEFLRNANRNAEAEPLYKRALAIREQALGPEHPDVAETLIGYAWVFQRTNRPVEFEKMKARGESIQQKHWQTNCQFEASH